MFGIALCNHLAHLALCVVSLVHATSLLNTCSSTSKSECSSAPDTFDSSVLIQSRVATGPSSTSWSQKTLDFIRHLEELESSPSPGNRTILLQRAASPVSSEFSEGSAVFVVMTDSNNYNNRLKWIGDTWGKDLPSSALLAIGDVAEHEAIKSITNVRVHATRCPQHTHDGACCKEAEAVIAAHDLLQDNPTRRWAFIVDDDAYVRPMMLEKKLQTFDDKNTSSGILAAVLGCQAKDCPGSFCGGGGHALNRQALNTIIGESPADFLKAHLAKCSKCGMWGDISLGATAVERKVSLQTLTGLNGWLMNKRVFDDVLERADEPLQYHPVRTEGQMRFFHELFNHKGIANQGKYCATYRGSTHCVADRESAPWDPYA